MQIVAIHGAANSGKSTFSDYLVNERGFVELALADPMKVFVMDIWGYSHESGNSPTNLRNGLWGPSSLRSGMLVARRPAENYKQIAADFVADTLRTINDVARDALIALVESCASRCLVPIREILQLLGTEWGRVLCGKDVWVKHLLHRINEVNDPTWFGWDKYEWGNALYRVPGVVVSDIRYENELEALSRDIPHDRARTIKIKLVREGVSGPLAGGLPGHTSENGLRDDLFDAIVYVPEGLPKMRHLIRALGRKFFY